MVEFKDGGVDVPTDTDGMQFDDFMLSMVSLVVSLVVVLDVLVVVVVSSGGFKFCGKVEDNVDTDEEEEEEEEDVEEGFLTDTALRRAEGNFLTGLESGRETTVEESNTGSFKGI
jgi:hypothetical protein